MEENHVKHHGACGGDDGDVGGHSGYRDGGGVKVPPVYPDWAIYERPW